MADQTNSPSYLDINDPSGAIQAMQLQRRLQIANALLQEGMSPMPGTQMAGQVAVKNSPLQGLAKIAQVIGGNYLGNKATTDLGTLQANRLQSLNDQNQTFANNPPAGGVNPMAGMTPQQITAWQLQNPGEYQKAISASNLQQQKPTETTLAAGQAGMPIEILQAMNARSLDKSLSNFKEDREGRIWDLTTGTLKGVAPNLPEGATYTGIGPNGFPTGMTQFPGAGGAIAQEAQNRAIGTTSGSLYQLTKPSGAVQPVMGSAFARLPNSLGAPPTGAPPAGSPAPAMPPQGAQQPMQPPQQQWGQTTSDAVIQKAAADHIATLPQLQTQLGQTKTGLELALQQMNTLDKSGPGTTSAMKYLAIANNLPGGQGLTDPVQAYQLVHKYLANAVSAAGQANGMGGSDARFNALEQGNPNVENMNLPALKSATRYVLSQVDGGIIGAKQQVDSFSQNSRSPQAGLQAQQGWANNYNPMVFAYNRMAPDERQKFIADLKAQDAKNPGALKAFQQQYNAAASKGWVQ